MFGRKKTLARIEALEAQVKRLENMPANVMLGRSWERPFEISRGAAWETNDGRVGFYGDRQLTAREVQFQTRHPHPKQVDYRCLTNVPTSTAETERISKVTFEELARLVVDGTPIKREEKISAKRISEYTEDTTTTITITE
jgi:hypothetical protein